MPFFRCSLETNLPPSAVLERIRSITRPTPDSFLARLGLYGSEKGPPFFGWVRGASFKLWRDARYRNSFRPVISGRITPATNGSRVKVTMFVSPFVGLILL